MPANLRYWLCTILTVTGLASAVAYGDQIKVIPLQHRPAKEIIPLITPMVEKAGGVVTGAGHKLIIRGRDSDLTQITALVRQLDTPPKQLRITLRQSRYGETGSSGHSMSIHAGDSGTSSNDTTTRVYSTRKRDQDATTQRIQVQEGRWATIDMILQVPVVEQTVDVTGGQQQVLNAIKYKDLTTGFAVRAMINGDQVSVDIMAHKAGLDAEQGGTIQSQAAATTVSGKVGEWIDIGGAVGNIVKHERGTISTGDRHRQEERHILLKVEVL